MLWPFLSHFQMKEHHDQRKEIHFKGNLAFEVALTVASTIFARKSGSFLPPVTSPESFRSRERSTNTGTGPALTAEAFRQTTRKAVLESLRSSTISMTI